MANFIPQRISNDTTGSPARDQPDTGGIVPERGAIAGAPIADAQVVPNNQPTYADASTSTDDLITDRSAMTVNWSTANETPESRGCFTRVIGNTLFKTVASGIAVGTAAAVVIPVAVTAIGFTAGGIAAGSTAASMMSVLGGGSTATGGVVATCQSIGAVGAISNTAASAWGCAGAAASYVFGGKSAENVPAESRVNALDASTSVDDLDTDRSVVGVNWHTLENTSDSNTNGSVDRDNRQPTEDADRSVDRDD